MKYFNHKIIRFLFAGAIGAATQVACLYFFTDSVGLWYLVSGFFAFIIAQMVSFTLQKLWTFRSYGTDGIYRQGMLYLATGACNLILTLVLLYFFVDVVGIHYILAQILTSIIIAIFSFHIYQTYIFTRATT